MNLVGLPSDLSYFTTDVKERIIQTAPLLHMVGRDILISGLGWTSETPSRKYVIHCL